MMSQGKTQSRDERGGFSRKKSKVTGGNFGLGERHKNTEKEKGRIDQKRTGRGHEHHRMRGP